MTAQELDLGRHVRRFAAVPEPAMRCVLWRETFAELDSQALLILVRHVIEGADRGKIGHRLALSALLEHIESLKGLSCDARRGLYEAARAHGCDWVMQLLLSGPALKEASPEELRVPPLSQEREVTLGERRFLARTHDRDVLQRLLTDPDDGVLDNLLSNPRLTETEVLRIASRRPAKAETLVRVAQHARWGRRPTIRVALVHNPYMPVALAVGLVLLLDSGQLRRVAADRSLSGIVRGRARELLRGRSGVVPAVGDP